MGKPRKKGEAGSAVNYMTRNQAIRKLQLTLPDFRKLCILKGIYPRDPPKKVSGTGKTYYLAKDLRFMMHDPLVDKFREHRAWRNKLRKAKARKLKDKVDSLIKNEPKYSLVHLIKERYPTFMDAVRDLDDAITMVHLFMLMPTKIIKPSRLENCRRLALEFQYFIVKTRALRKVFISIKGIYFQAELFGQTITWIVPHRFNQSTSTEVDYSVMLSFLEFHEVLMGFVNYKLFYSIGMKYPLFFDDQKAGEGEHLRSVTATALTSDVNPTKVPQKILKQTESRIHTLDDLLRKIAKQDEKEQTEMKVDEQPAHPAENEQGDIFDAEEQADLESLEKFKGLFNNLIFFLSREVPRENLEFMIRAFGGQVTWEGGSIPEESSQVTHQIVDRGSEPSSRRVEREYIQPQWIFDCINAKVLLPVDIYGPTSKLPPHLSPFVDRELEGYTPEYEKKIEQYIAQAKGDVPASIDMDDGSGTDEESEESENEERVYTRELEEERRGKYKADSNGEEESSEASSQSGEDVSESAMVEDHPVEEYVDEEDKYMAKHALRNKGIDHRYIKKRKRSAQEVEEEEAQAMAQSMLPNKKRKLLEHLQRGKLRSETRVGRLESKKRDIANKSLEVNSQGILVKK